MKTIFRNLGLGILMTGCVAVGATDSFAQDVCAEIEAKQALYKQFTDNLDKKDIPSRKIAVDAGKQYVQKYAACADDKAIVDYLNANVPAMEKSITDQEKKAGKAALLTRFDAAAKAKNVPEIYASGKEILSKESEYADVALDVAIALAVAGFEQSAATTPVDTYNADTLTYAKSAIQRLESGKTSKSLGVWSYNLKPADKTKFTDEKSYALGALNYIIGNVTYYRQGKDNAEKKKEALASFYKSAQFNSLSKTDPTVYQAIGAWYLDEAIKIDKDRQAKLTANGNKDNEETLAMVGNQKGYADRSIDAYARAYKIAKEDKAQKKEYVDSLYARLKTLYEFRYDGKTDGIDAFVSTVQSKPMPDPLTAVTPVVEAVPATTPATNSSTTTTTPATTTTKPAATTAPTKPVSAATPAATEVKTTATTTDKPATKLAPKKKGTR